MTGRFDTVVVVDWSARATPSPAKPTKDAIFIGMARDGYLATSYQRTRHAAMRFLQGLIRGERRAGRRMLIGFDFPFGYPAGFGQAVIGTDDPFAVWEAWATRVDDDARNANNRFDVAARLNAACGGDGPFWGRPQGREVPGLPFRKPLHAHPFAERREVERRIPRAKTCFQLMGAGSVGSQAILGIAALSRLRAGLGDAVRVVPFEPAEGAEVVLAEVYPGLIAEAIARHARPGEIPDRAQVRLLAKALERLPAARLDASLREGHRTEGWILGTGAEAELADALAGP